jgi:hypothetical protein
VLNLNPQPKNVIANQNKLINSQIIQEIQV